MSLNKMVGNQIPNAHSKGAVTPHKCYHKQIEYDPWSVKILEKIISSQKRVENYFMKIGCKLWIVVIQLKGTS